jgi:hypothetical protein
MIETRAVGRLLVEILIFTVINPFSGSLVTVVRVVRRLINGLIAYTDCDALIRITFLSG